MINSRFPGVSKTNTAPDITGVTHVVTLRRIIKIGDHERAQVTTVLYRRISWPAKVL